MGIIFAIIFGFIVVENISSKTEITTEEKKTQVALKKDLEKKTNVLETNPKPKKPVPIKEVKPEPKKLEPIKEVKPEPNKLEPIKEVKPEPKKLEPIKEVKLEPKKPELIVEAVNEIQKENNQGTGWLDKVLYIFIALLIIGGGKFLYSRFRNNSSSNTVSDYMRKEFKEEVQSETTEQEPAEEELQSETTEQEPAEEEVQSETTEQQQVKDEDENNQK
jgi:C4-dicarboxylate-specific signal transduction histidine kinase